MGKDLVVGLSAIFLLWVTAIAVASTTLVWSNWKLFVTWRHQARETRLRMALWLAIPLLMYGLIWMRGIAIWHYAVVYYVPDVSLFQMLVYLPVILVALALILWWICDRTFEAARGDRIWCLLVWSGLALGVFTTFLTWRYPIHDLLLL